MTLDELKALAEKAAFGADVMELPVGTVVALLAVAEAAQKAMAFIDVGPGYLSIPGNVERSEPFRDELMGLKASIQSLTDTERLTR